MRKLSLSILVTCIAISLVACASTAKLSPKGVRDYHAKELVRTLGLLQDAAIDANKAGAFTEANTTKVVKFVKASVQAEKAQQEGWVNGIDQALNSLETELGPSSSLLNLYVISIRSALVVLAK